MYNSIKAMGAEYAEMRPGNGSKPHEQVNSIVFFTTIPSIFNSTTNSTPRPLSNDTYSYDHLLCNNGMNVVTIII